MVQSHFGIKVSLAVSSQVWTIIRLRQSAAIIHVAVTLLPAFFAFVTHRTNLTSSAAAHHINILSASDSLKIPTTKAAKETAIIAHK
jgi:hypothetical protein